MISLSAKRNINNFKFLFKIFNDNLLNCPELQIHLNFYVAQYQTRFTKTFYIPLEK